MVLDYQVLTVYLQPPLIDLTLWNSLWHRTADTRPRTIAKRLLYEHLPLWATIPQLEPTSQHAAVFPLNVRGGLLLAWGSVRGQPVRSGPKSTIRNCKLAGSCRLLLGAKAIRGRPLRIAGPIYAMLWRWTARDADDFAIRPDMKRRRFAVIGLDQILALSPPIGK